VVRPILLTRMVSAYALRSFGGQAIERVFVFPRQSGLCKFITAENPTLSPHTVPWYYQNPRAGRPKSIF